MLKTISAVSLAASAEVGDEKQNGKRIQVDGNKKEPTQPAQKSHKVQSKGQKMAKSKKWIRAEKSEASRAKNFCSQSGSFFIPEARKDFIALRQAFVEALILNHFNPKRHIQIEINTSSYAIGGILRQLTSNNLGQWYPVAFFSRKLIPTKTWYETPDKELLAIVEAFKTWRHYLEGCKHEILVLTDHNNLQRFMDTKSLSSRQVWWAQELSRYHFRIDYQQGKVNGAVDTLSWYSQQSTEEKETLWAENTKILHRLWSLLARVSELSVSGLSVSSLLHQVLICGTVVLLQLRQFWDTIWNELADKGSYTASIGDMRMKLFELQDDDKEAMKLRSEELPECQVDIEQVLHY